MTKLLHKDSCTLCRTMGIELQWQLYKAVQSATVQSCTKVQRSWTKYNKVVQSCLCTKTVVQSTISVVQSQADILPEELWTEL